jgi:hypothetical protein
MSCGSCSEPNLYGLLTWLLGSPAGMVELQPTDLRSLRLHISLLRDDFCKWVFCDYEANMLFIYGAIF